MVDFGEYSDTVQLIYEAGYDFRQWPIVLERLSEGLGASVCSLVRHNLATSEGAMTMVRTDPTFARLYTERYAKLNVFAQRAGNRPAGTCLTDRMALPKEELFKTEFYAGFMRPQDAHSLLNVYLLCEGDSGTRIAFGRSHRAGEWEQEQIEYLRIFAPHLHRAALVSRQLESCQFGAEGAMAALNRLTQGVIIVDAESRPSFVNRAAETILIEADGLAVGLHGLRAANREQTTVLRRLIAEAAGEHGARASGCALSIARPSLRRSYTLLVAPLPATFGRFLPPRPRAIVFVRNPAVATPTPTSHLRQLYGLTAAEAALTDEIVRGRGLQAAADALGVTLTTARTHLQRVFQKTQTHRQAQLVRLIIEMRAGLAFDHF